VVIAIDQVQPREHQLDHVRAQGHALVPRPLQDRLQLVGQLQHQVAADEAGAALQGMDRAEELVQQLLVRGLLLQAEQRLLPDLQAVFGLGQEGLAVFRGNVRTNSHG
jgi:hypothetical protein